MKTATPAIGVALLLASILARSATPGDAVVSGNVLDQGGAVVADGYVSMTSADDRPLTAGATDERGQFVLRGLAPGSYRLRIEASGQEPLTLDVLIGDKNSTYNLGELRLGLATLDEVEVTGERGLGLGQQVYDLADSAAQSTGSALDVMRALPGVTVNPEGQLQLRGSDRVAILIDGKPSALVGTGDQRGLESMPAGNIARIEIINNPSARHDAAGMAGVINIVYEKKAAYGWSGDTGLTMRVGRLDRGRDDLPTELGSYTANPKIGPSLNLNYNDDRLRGFMQLEYLNLKGLPNNEFHTRYYDDGTTILSQVPENRKQWRYIAKAGMDWNLASGDQYSLSVARDYELHNDRAQVPFIDAASDVRFRYWFWHEKESTEFTNVATSYKWQLEGPGHTLNLRAEYARGKEDEAYFLNEDSTVRTGTDFTHIIADENTLPVTLDYVRPTRSGRIEFGVKYQKRWIPVTYDTVRGERSVIYPGLGDWSDWDEDIHAGYLNWVRETERLDIEFGLRAENTKVAYEIPLENIYYPGSDSYDYFELFPNIKFTWPVGSRNSMLAAFNRRVDRPGEPQLRIFAKYDDPELLKVGNPYLRPQFTDAFEVGFQHRLSAGTLSLSAFHRRIEDAFIRVFAIDDSDPDYSVVNKIYHNVGTSQQSGLEFIASRSISTRGSVSGSINVYRNEIDAYDTVLYFPYTRPFSLEASSTTTWDLKLNSQWRLPASWQLQTSFAYYAARNVAQGRELARSSFDFTLKRPFMGNAEFALSVVDLFNDFAHRHEARAPGVLTVYENRFETQVVGAAIKYRF